MSILEMILYPTLAVGAVIWLIFIIRKAKKIKKNKQMGIDDEE